MEVKIVGSIKVGFIGLGNMGIRMAKSLVKEGFSLTVFDLRQEPIDEMRELGAAGASSSREVAEASDVVISMVWDTTQTEEVIFGKDGVWKGIKMGATIIVSSSVGPEYCRKLYTRMKEQGVRVIDCCVTGRDPLNGNRPMTLMIGGDEDIVKQCWPVFEALGKNIFYLGGIGAGQAYKLMNNVTGRHIGIAIHACLIEGLNLGLKAGLDLQKMIEVMSAGAFARHIQNLGLKPGLDVQQIVEIIRAPATKPPGSKAHLIDELDYAKEMAEAVGAKMPVFQFIDELDAESTYDAYFALLNQYMPNEKG
jgi:3-hydroxyisobutyrate dehydrogenase-like beta-hydroxyacid dehydrogenase